MSDKLDFTFTNAISVHRPYRKTSRILPRLVMIAAVLAGIAAFSVVRWVPVDTLFISPPATEIEVNPLYDAH